MSVNQYPSRVHAALRAMKARLGEQDWPAHPVTGELPALTFVDADPAFPSEVVALVAEAGDDATIDQRLLPRGRRETFDIVVVIRTLTDSGEDDALTRCEELSTVAQRALYDDRLDTSAAFKNLPLDGAVEGSHVSQVLTQLTPAPDGQIRTVDVVRFTFRFEI